VEAEPQVHGSIVGLDAGLSHQRGEEGKGERCSEEIISYVVEAFCSGRASRGEPLLFLSIENVGMPVPPSRVQSMFSISVVIRFHWIVHWCVGVGFSRGGGGAGGDAHHVGEVLIAYYRVVGLHVLQNACHGGVVVRHVTAFRGFGRCGPEGEAAEAREVEEGRGGALYSCVGEERGPFDNRCGGGGWSGAATIAECGGEEAFVFRDRLLCFSQKEASHFLV